MAAAPATALTSVVSSVLQRRASHEIVAGLDLVEDHLHKIERLQSPRGEYA
jgi:hypothetical protein